MLCSFFFKEPSNDLILDSTPFKDWVASVIVDLALFNWSSWGDTLLTASMVLAARAGCAVKNGTVASESLVCIGEKNSDIARSVPVATLADVFNAICTEGFSSASARVIISIGMLIVCSSLPICCRSEALRYCVEDLLTMKASDVIVDPTRKSPNSVIGGYLFVWINMMLTLELVFGFVIVVGSF